MILECYNVLKKMEQKPSMWTGENNLRSIKTYTSGYYQALFDHNIVGEPETDDPFFDWVAEKLGYFESTAGWVNMILAYSLGYQPQNIEWEQFLNKPISEEEHANSIKFFYQLIGEFKDEKVTKN